MLGLARPIVGENGGWQIAHRTPPQGALFRYDESLLMNDAQIRAATKKALLVQHMGDAETVIFEELGVQHGLARIDLAVVNGELHGFELKSARDTLARLPEQAESYGRVFDRITLVVEERHVRGAVELVPDWWGVQSCLPGIRQTSFLRFEARREEPFARSCCDSGAPLARGSLTFFGGTGYCRRRALEMQSGDLFEDCHENRHRCSVPQGADVPQDTGKLAICRDATVMW